MYKCIYFTAKILRCACLLNPKYAESRFKYAEIPHAGTFGVRFPHRHVYYGIAINMDVLHLPDCHYTRETTNTTNDLPVILNAFHALFPFLMIFFCTRAYVSCVFFLHLHNVSLVSLMKLAAEQTAPIIYYI